MIDIAKSTDRSSNVDIPSVGYKTSYESVMVTPSFTFYEDFVERKMLSEIHYNLYKNRPYIIKSDLFREGRHIVFIKNIHIQFQLSKTFILLYIELSIQV